MPGCHLDPPARFRCAERLGHLISLAACKYKSQISWSTYAAATSQRFRHPSNALAYAQTCLQPDNLSVCRLLCKAQALKAVARSEGAQQWHLFPAHHAT